MGSRVQYRSAVMPSPNRNPFKPRRGSARRPLKPYRPTRQFKPRAFRPPVVYRPMTPYIPKLPAPVVGGLRGLGTFLRGVNIFTVLLPDPNITLLPQGAAQPKWVFEQPGYITVYCPWAGDPSQRALDHIGIENISAQFNCGIFPFPNPAVTPGPVTGNSYEVWGSYANFPGEWASIVQVLNFPPPAGAPLLGAVGPEPFVAPPAPVPVPFTRGRLELPAPAGHGNPDPFPPPFAGDRNHSPHLGPNHFNRKPPKDGTVERKRVVPYKPWQRFINAVANTTSESADFVNSAYRALPRWAQTDRSGTIQGELSSVYNYLKNNPKDTNFIPRLVRNVIQDQITDYALGQIGRAGKRAVRRNPYWGSKTGLQAGGRYRPQVNW